MSFVAFIVFGRRNEQCVVGSAPAFGNLLGLIKKRNGFIDVACCRIFGENMLVGVEGSQRDFAVCIIVGAGGYSIYVIACE